MNDSDRPLRVSIITPTRNQGQFIGATIRSVLAQDYPAIEYLVIDGDSEDSTRDVIAAYRDRIAYFVSEPDSGQSAAINKGIRASTGDVIMWLNSDDLLTPGAVRIAVEALTKHPDVDVVYSDFWSLEGRPGRARRRKAWQVDLGELIKRNIIPQPTAFIRRRLLDRIGLVDESMHLAMDWDLWLRSAQVARLLYLPRPALAVLRDHPEAKTRAYYGRRVAEQLTILDRFYTDSSLPRCVRRQRGISYSHVYWEAAEHAALRNRAFPDGIGWLARSILSHPIGVVARPRTSLLIALAALQQLLARTVRRDQSTEPAGTLRTRGVGNF